MNVSEITLRNGNSIKMDFDKAFIYGNAGCGKGFVTKHKVAELLSQGKRIYLCDVYNEYQFDDYENLKSITRKIDDSYAEWIKSIVEFLGNIPSCENDDAWFVVDDLNNLDSVKVLLEIVEEKNLNLIIVSQEKPNNIVDEFFAGNEILNLSYATY